VRRFPRLKLALVGKKRLKEAVRERAIRAFFEKGLYRTRGETGILIFISIMERKVWILGDRGINERIDPQLWLTLAGELAGRVKEGHAFDGLCTVIEKLGNVLKEHFPKEADDTNELSDEVIF
jgi:putative membrane protein